MIVVWGAGNYGKCDEVPGLCYVVTRFGHFYHVPLIPTSSYLVVREDGDVFHGVRIPLCIKSVLLAWIRGALTLGIIVGVALTASAFVDPAMSEGPPLAVTLICSALLYATFRLRCFRLASRDRAMDLCESLRLDPSEVALINRFYDALEQPESIEAFESDRPFDSDDP